MQANRSRTRIGDIRGGIDVIVVTVCATQTDQSSTAHGFDDRRRVVRGVDHQYFFVVADQPDVVVDFEVLSVERENAVGDDKVQLWRHRAYSTTTERNTSPRSIR